jgi:hypothetical protein
MPKITKRLVERFALIVAAKMSLSGMLVTAH